MANSVNDAIKSHEDAQRLLDLQRSFTNLDGPLLAPGRRLLKSGALLKTCKRDEEMRHFFLFSDLLIYGSALDATSGWSRAMSMTGLAAAVSAASIQSSSDKRLSVCSNLSAPSMSRTASSHSSTGSVYGHEQRYQFHRRIPLKDLTVIGADGLYFEMRSSERSFAVAADSPDTKEDWMSAIRTAKEELMSKRVTLNTDTIRQARKRANSFPRLSTSPLPHFGFEPASSPIQEEAPSLSTTPIPTPSLASHPATPTQQVDVTALLLSPQQEATSAGQKSLAMSPPPQVFVEEPSEIPVAYNYSSPVWIPDAKASKCLLCQDAFGLWRRKHHCRLCGHVICWSCSKNVGTSAPLRSRLPRLPFLTSISFFCV